MPADVSFDGPLIRYGLTDWKVYVPLGLALSVPFLANEVRFLWVVVWVCGVLWWWVDCWIWASVGRRGCELFWYVYIYIPIPCLWPDPFPPRHPTKQLNKHQHHH